MTRVQDKTIWITNDPSGGDDQSNEGAAAAGLVAGMVEAGKKLFGDKTSEQRRDDYIRQTEASYNTPEAREAARATNEKIYRDNERRKQERIDFQTHARQVTAGDLPRLVRERTAQQGTVSQRVLRQAIDRITEFSNKDQGLRRMPRYIMPRLSDFKWRGPNGDLSDHGTIDPADFDLGHGGRYTFNQVHNESLPYYQRAPLATFHRRIADTYAISAEEAALAVVAEFANPGCAEGLSRFRAPGTLAVADHSQTTSGLDLYVQEYTVLNIMHSELDSLRRCGGPSGANIDSPEAALKHVTDRIDQMQSRRMFNIAWAAYRSTHDVVVSRAEGVLRDAMVKVERHVEDFDFAHNQYLKISDACVREDLSRLMRCGRSISSHSSDAAEDAAAAVGAQAAVGRLDARSGTAFAITSGHRVIRAARRSPACRDAYEAYRDRACMKRVMPHGAVKVDTWLEGLYVAPGKSYGGPAASSEAAGGDSVWDVAGRDLSRAVMGETPAAGGEVSWAEWSQVGGQISRRIMTSKDAGSSDAISLARYYGVCWAKAKDEEPEHHCLAAFKSHAWRSAGDAVAAGAASRMGGVWGKNAAKVLKIKIAIDSLRGTLGDERCDLKEVERTVDACVGEMYTAARQIDEEDDDDQEN